MARITLSTALLAALLLEACADENPTGPDGTDPPPAAALGMNQDGTRVVIEPHWLTLDTIGVTGTLTATVIDAAGDTVDGARVTWTSADTAIATVDTAGVATSVAFGRTKVTATHDSATARATVEVAAPLTDREILEILHEATEGSGWTDNTNWLSDEDLDDWYGVNADADGRVTRLSLRRNGLTGAIPPEVGGLSRLDRADLSHNGITGHLPAELGKLTRLRRLEVNNNEFGGGMPPEMGGMENLDYLDVAHNSSLGGTIPHTFAGLDLERFYSTRTGLCVPPSLQTWFDGIPRTDNPTICTGRITLHPSSLYFEAIGDTATLAATAVTADGDTLHHAAVAWSSADTDIATVDSAGLVTTVGYGATQVAAAADSLTGTAEVEIVFKLSDREVLEILHGATDGENWTDTTNWLSDEPLSAWAGVETDEEGQVVVLSLGDNNLTGSIPHELGELDGLLTLDLGRNALTGPVPGHLGALRQLRDLLLDHNALHGPLPRDLGNLTALRYLHLGTNELTGPVPGSFAGLALDTLYAAGSGACVPPSLDEWFAGIEQTDAADRCIARLAVTVDLPSPTFYAPGETANLSATYVSAEGDSISDVPATWSSGDTAVARVDASGTVTAVGDGMTELTATYDSAAGSITVEVDLPDSDRDVLAILFARARGDGWTDATNWLSDEPLSDWAGVQTDDSGRVVSLSLPGNNLRGPIHASIGLLDRLVTLDLSRNWISGPIPVQFADLKLLRGLALSVNGLVGNLPPALGTLDSLRTLKLAATSVSGQVPTSYAELNLDTLVTSGTTVCVPPSLSAWLDSIPEADDPPECASRVVVGPASLTFDARGDTVRLSATVIDAEGDVVEDAEVTWTSGDSMVARVGGTGLVTARASGATDVTATYDSVTAAAADVVVRLPGSDRVALEAFYRATGGDDWTDNTNWLSDEPLGAWYGVDTTRDGRVKHLDMPDNNLTGRIPAAVSLLDSLIRLDFHRNSVAGPVPSAVGRLKSLRNLYLSHNDLSGRLPSQMGGMAGLRRLELDHNEGLSGPVPETFGALTLSHVAFGDGDLCLPRSLDAWFREIPQRDTPPPCIPETADRAVLESFYDETGGEQWETRDNWRTGKSLNTWRGITTDDEGYVTEIFLPYNNLTGGIPPELGNLTRLEVFTAYGNELAGRIPPELGRLTKVRRISLSDNKLEGPIPPELAGMVSINTLYIRRNRLSGPIPAEFGELTNLENLSLSGNRLSGPIPPELGNLKNLKYLWASDNQLQGPLPPELGNLQALKFLTVWNNRVDGTIPPEIGNLSSLETLVLSKNRLSGSIPPELGGLTNLEHLGLYGNELSGPIPPELGGLPKLVDFWLSENRLTGTIPAELGRLSTVEDFGVQNNNLSGPIPREFGRMSSLIQLALYNNNLSGPLPPEVGNLSNLEWLSVRGNPDLEGLLPRTLMDVPLSLLDIARTDLCPQLDDGFQEWLDGIGRAYGLGCPATRIERFALLELYNGTGGDSWTNNDGWDTDFDVGDWYGVTVAAEDLLVQQLRLPDNGLDGPLPLEIGNLRALETLDVAGNTLNGALPVVITSMNALDTVRLTDNENMEGPLPFRMTDLEHLTALEIEDTDLCASPAPTFQEWINSLDVFRGSTCHNPDSVKLSLPVVYLTQAIQRREGDVPLLSRREALLRVFLVGDRENAFFEPEVVATFIRDGEEVHRVVMRSEGDRISTFVDESDLGKSYSAVIPARHIVGGTELVVVADSAETIPRAAGSETRYPATGAASLDAIEAPAMELTVVPVLEAEDPDSSIFDWTDGIDDDSPQVGQFRYSFPFSEFSARSREAYVTSLDLTEDDDQWSLVLELERVRAEEEATGYWYGAALSRNGYVRGVARRNGWVSIGKPEAPELAHEVGHNLNLRHAPCGGAGGTDPDFPYPTGKIGAWGYDFRDGSLLDPRRVPDVMGYCYRGGRTSWLSDYYYEKVIRLREEKEGDRDEGTAGKGPKGEMLVLWGGLVSGELRIEPVHATYTTVAFPRETGPYRLQGIARDGDIEFSLSFTPGEDKYGNKYFLFTIPIEAHWEESLERITLTGPEGEVSVDRNDPRSLTIVTDPATGRIRAILRDWNRPLPAALGDTGGLEVVTTRGIVDAVRLGR